MSTVSGKPQGPVDLSAYVSQRARERLASEQEAQPRSPYAAYAPRALREADQAGAGETGRAPGASESETREAPLATPVAEGEAIGAVSEHAAREDQSSTWEEPADRHASLPADWTDAGRARIGPRRRPTRVRWPPIRPQAMCPPSGSPLPRRSRKRRRLCSPGCCANGPVIRSTRTTAIPIVISIGWKRACAGCRDRSRTCVCRVVLIWRQFPGSHRPTPGAVAMVMIRRPGATDRCARWSRSAWRRLPQAWAAGAHSA